MYPALFEVLRGQKVAHTTVPALLEARSVSTISNHCDGREHLRCRRQLEVEAHRRGRPNVHDLALKDEADSCDLDHLSSQWRSRERETTRRAALCLGTRIGDLDTGFGNPVSYT